MLTSVTAAISRCRHQPLPPSATAAISHCCSNQPLASSATTNNCPAEAGAAANQQCYYQQLPYRSGSSYPGVIGRRTQHQRLALHQVHAGQHSERCFFSPSTEYRGFLKGQRGIQFCGGGPSTTLALPWRCPGATLALPRRYPGATLAPSWHHPGNTLVPHSC